MPAIKLNTYTTSRSPLNQGIFAPFITQNRKIATTDKIPTCKSICISSFFTSHILYSILSSNPAIPLKELFLTALERYICRNNWIGIQITNIQRNVPMLKVSVNAVRMI
jgi:hypothetical protein